MEFLGCFWTILVNYANGPYKIIDAELQIDDESSNLGWVAYQWYPKEGYIREWNIILQSEENLHRKNIDIPNDGKSLLIFRIIECDRLFKKAIIKIFRYRKTTHQSYWR